MGSVISGTTELTADAREVIQHLDRLLKSDLIRRSASLCHLLQYLVDRALQADGEHIKESIIAIDVFHRSGDFDSRTDNIVRVHAHRLRKILDLWYTGDGVTDRIRFVIPKGNYMLRIETNEIPAPATAIVAELEEAQGPPDAAPQIGGTHPSRRDSAAITCACSSKAEVTEPKASPEPKPEPAPPPRPRGVPVGLVWAALAFGLVAGGAGVSFTMHRASVPASNALMRPPLSALWKNVFRRDTETVVSFTNPAFLRTSGSPRVYITYQGPLNAPNGAEANVLPGAPLDQVMAPLGPLFSATAGPVLEKRWPCTGSPKWPPTPDITSGRFGPGALTYADVRNANVIFIGSPWANDMQAKFNIELTPFQCFGTQKIVNKHPAAGEPPVWYAELNPATNELAATYAVFSLLPGAGVGTRMVSSSGIDTYSTMAALDLMTTASGVRDLMSRFGTAHREEPARIFSGRDSNGNDSRRTQEFPPSPFVH